jgi:hypothetical protein
MATNGPDPASDQGGKTRAEEAVTPVIAAVHESLVGTNRTSGGVWLESAIGGKAD